MCSTSRPSFARWTQGSKVWRPGLFRTSGIPDSIQEGEQKQEEDSDEDDLDRPHFSLITGKYHHAKRYGGVQSVFSNM